MKSFIWAAVLTVIAAASASAVASLLLHLLSLPTWPLLLQVVGGFVLALVALALAHVLFLRLLCAHNPGLGAGALQPGHDAHKLVWAAVAASVAGALGLHAVAGAAEAGFGRPLPWWLPVVGTVVLVLLAGLLLMMARHSLPLGPLRIERLDLEKETAAGQWIDLVIGLSPPRPATGLPEEAQEIGKRWPKETDFAREIVAWLRNQAGHAGCAEQKLRAMATQRFDQNHAANGFSCDYPVSRGRSPWRLALWVIAGWFWPRGGRVVYLVPSTETEVHYEDFLKALSLLAGPIHVRSPTDEWSCFTDGKREDLGDPPAPGTERLVAVLSPVEVFDISEGQNKMQTTLQHAVAAMEGCTGAPAKRVIHDMTFMTALFSLMTARPTINRGRGGVGYAYIAQDTTERYDVLELSALNKPDTHQ